MPRIQEYQAGTGQLQVPEGGAEAFSLVGRRTGAMFHEAGEQIGSAAQGIYNDYERHQSMMEISHGAAAWSGQVADLTRQWNDWTKNADPNDQTIAQRFNDQVVNPALEKFQQSFSTDAGQRWSLEHVDGFRQHFAGLAMGTMSRMAGDAAHQNLQVTVNNLSHLVEQDPSSFTYATGLLSSAIDGIVQGNQNISGEDAAKMKTEFMQKGGEQLARTSVSSLALKNPDAAEQLVNSGRYADYLNGPETISAIRQIRTAKRQDAATARVLQDYAERKQSEANYADIIGQGTIVNGKYVLPDNAKEQAIALASKGLLKDGEFKSIVSTKSPQEENYDPARYTDLLTGIGDGTTTTKAITEAYRDGEIKAGEFHALTTKSLKQGNLIHTVTNDPMVKTEINKAMGVIQGTGDPQNGAMINAKNQFRADVLRTMTDEGAGDWHQYVDPHDPKYLFTPERIQRYRPTSDEVKQGMLNRASGPGSTGANQSAPPANDRPPLVFQFNLPPKGQ